MANNIIDKSIEQTDKVIDMLKTSMQISDLYKKKCEIYETALRVIATSKDYACASIAKEVLEKVKNAIK